MPCGANVVDCTGGGGEYVGRGAIVVEMTWGRGEGVGKIMFWKGVSSVPER